MFCSCVSLRRFVTDATVSLFVAILLFVFPSEPPYFLCFWRSSDTGDTCMKDRVIGTSGPSSGVCWDLEERSLVLRAVSDQVGRRRD